MPAADDVNEVWVPLPDYEGLYEVSHLGRVRSLHPRHPEPRLIAFGTDGTGYVTVSLSKAGQRTTKTLHRLVCRAFHGEPGPLHREAAHLDGKKANCRASNLKWCSKVENHFHKRFHGTHGAGERHPKALLSEAAVRVILVRLANGETAKQIAPDFGVSAHTVDSIRLRKNWGHVKGPSMAYAPRSSGHGQRGEGNHGAKLTETQATEIRARGRAGETCRALGQEFGVGRATINRIVRGLSYGKT